MMNIAPEAPCCIRGSRTSGIARGRSYQTADFPVSGGSAEVGVTYWELTHRFERWSRARGERTQRDANSELPVRKKNPSFCVSVFHQVESF